MQNPLRMAAIVSLALALVLSTGCSKKKDPGDQLIAYSSSMLEIVKKNKDDCAKLVTELEAFVSTHGTERKEITQQGEALNKSMSDQEKKDYEAKLLTKMQPTMKEAMGLMTEIGQKCPEQIQKISAAWREVR
jgi:hypothetical protein